jgi:hypothetical protein
VTTALFNPLLSLTEVASICRVDSRLVIKWIKIGALLAHWEPTGHGLPKRVVWYQDLVAFFGREGFPFDWLYEFGAIDDAGFMGKV